LIKLLDFLACVMASPGLAEFCGVVDKVILPRHSYVRIELFLPFASDARRVIGYAGELGRRELRGHREEGLDDEGRRTAGCTGRNFPARDLARFAGARAAAYEGRRVPDNPLHYIHRFAAASLHERPGCAVL
jgi:hypothetical protein